MRTTYIILGSFLLLVIGVCGYFFFFTGSGDSSVKWYGQVEQKIPSTYAESVMETQQVQVSDIDLYNTAIEQQDLSKCESISDIEKKNTCHDNIVASDAQKSLDTKKCQSLSQSGMVSICEDNIYNAQAIGKLDTSLCAKISAKNIWDYCTRKVDAKKLTVALEKNTISPEFCASLWDESRTECENSLERVDTTQVYTDAISSKDPRLCETIVDPTFKSNCYNAIYLQLALSANDVQKCDAITDTVKREYCISKLEKKSEAVQLKEIVAGGDIAGCNTLSTEPLKYQCSDMITMAQVRTTHDPDLCDNLFNTGLQYACAQLASATSTN